MACRLEVPGDKDDMVPISEGIICPKNLGAGFGTTGQRLKTQARDMGSSLLGTSLDA